MELSWFACLLYGLIGGFAQFLPVSEDAHAILFAQMSGVSDMGSPVRLAVHIGALIALCTLYWPQLNRLNRERRIASLPPRRRKRQPDAASLMDLRFLNTAVIPLVIVTAVKFFTAPHVNLLWVLAAGSLLNGILLYTFEHMPRSNKDARMLSRLDALFIGTAGTLAILPGASCVGSLTCAAQLRGVERQYALQTVMLLTLPVLIVLIVLDIIGIAAAGLAWLTVAGLACFITALAAAVFSSYFGIILMRFLAVKVGYTAFAFYSWGMALFTFILYLMI